MRINSKHDLQRYLDRYTYKPGSSIVVGNMNMRGRVEINLYLRSPDVSDPSRLAKITTTQELEFPVETGHLEMLIYSGWKYLESHEIDEWLKFDGECVNDPHPELKHPVV